MARKFTRIEFEGDYAIVVTRLQHGAGHLIRGNQISGWNSFTGFYHLSHTEAVNRVIENIGRRVKRRLTHFVA